MCQVAQALYDVGAGRAINCQAASTSYQTSFGVTGKHSWAIGANRKHSSGFPTWCVTARHTSQIPQRTFHLTAKIYTVLLSAVLHCSSEMFSTFDCSYFFQHQIHVFPELQFHVHPSDFKDLWTINDVSYLFELVNPVYCWGWWQPREPAPAQTIVQLRGRDSTIAVGV